MIGLPKSSRATPVARNSARAPAMLRPCVTVRDRSSGMPRMVARAAGRPPDAPRRPWGPQANQSVRP